MISFSKPACHSACQAYVQARLATARTEMQAAQESSNSETKSSAGDKYETARAMAQQERDHHASQLHEALRLEAELARLNPNLPCDAVRPGALVTTSLGVFYLSIGVGRLTTAAGQVFMAVSPAAPVALALKGKRAGEQAVLNGQTLMIEAVG